MPNSNKLPAKTGLLASLGISSKRYTSEFISPATEIRESDAFLYGGGTTVTSLLGSGKKQARSRDAIFAKWSYMESDAIISSALKLNATATLGGHETTGDIVFLEKKPEAEKNKQLAKVCDEIAKALQPLFNRVAFPITYTGLAFGDGFARIYSDRSGVVDLYTDEMVRPPLVQPFEKGNRTVGYALFIGNRNFERLNVGQMARLKMPRTQFVPQFGVVDKSLRQSIAEDDINNLPVLPSMAGGSILYNAEDSYDNLTASLLGMVGQRWLDSIDEQIITPNLNQMTQEQQKRFLASLKSMLTASKKRAQDAIDSGRPVLERIRHIIPTFAEKQLTTVSPANGGQSGRAGNITIEDVMIHARMTTAALGVDLSMVGFADQLTGGLGEGGFFRTSAQAAEQARTTRSALNDFFWHIIDIHTMNRYGFVFNPHERPLTINFYGSISALEAEKQRTRADSMNSGMMLVQGIQSMKDMGATKEIMRSFLSKTMMLDDDQAELFSTIVEVKDNNEDDGENNGGGSGFGGNFGARENQ